MSAPHVTIVDYQLGNLFSVRMACEALGAQVTVSSQADDLRNARALILPGVGAFGQAMDNLHELGLIDPLLEHVAAAKPLFGICLGLQLLFEESEEFGNPRGLGILKGKVRKLPVTDAPVPQIGWNRIESARDWQNSPLRDVPSSSWMYFVHSYYVDNSNPEDALCRTDYAGFNYTSAVLKDSVFATQYHPEKSSLPGLEIYRNWLAGLK